MKQDTIVIDIDGTLSNCNHRRHFVEGKHRDYAKFHALLGEDSINNWCRKLMGLMFSEYNIVLVSARPKSTTISTQAWLHLHEVLYDDLFILRPDGDSTPDQELKRKWLYEYGKDRILFVVDDRSKVVRMWREEGLTCLHCADYTEKKA